MVQVIGKPGNGWRLFPGLCALLVLLGGVLGLSCEAASVTATLNPSTVSVGDSATLTLHYEGGQPSGTPTPPEIPGLRFSPGQTLQSMTIVQGQYSASYSQEYSVTPLKAGDYVIPAFTVTVGGQNVSTTPLQLKVVAADPAQQLVSMKLDPLQDGHTIAQREFYAGEVVAVALQVVIRNNVANGPEILQSFDQFSGTPLKGDGFSVIKTAHAQQRPDNQTGTVAGGLVTTIVPMKPGPLVINSIEANLDLQIGPPGQRRRDPFDLFGMLQQYRTRKTVLVAEPLTLTILPLPKENVPAGFQGAVGTYTITATAGPTNVAAGDPITVKVSISGKGNLESLPMPDTSLWKDFKSYPATSRFDADDALGASGTRTFEQVVVPQSAGAQVIPPLRFSFFDPAVKAYRTVSTDPLPLLVRPAGSAVAPTVAAARPREEDNSPTADILHIKPKMGALAQLGPPLILRPWFVGLQLLPVAGALGAWIWRRRTDALAHNPRARRQRQVAAVVQQGLVELSRLAKANDSDGFFASLFRLLQEQLGERLDLPASAITEAVVPERLRPGGVPESLLSELEALFQACNQARYAPSRSSQELQAYLPRIQAVFQQLPALKL